VISENFILASTIALHHEYHERQGLTSKASQTLYHNSMALFVKNISEFW